MEQSAAIYPALHNSSVFWSIEQPGTRAECIADSRVVISIIESTAMTFDRFERLIGTFVALDTRAQFGAMNWPLWRMVLEPDGFTYLQSLCLLSKTLEWCEDNFLKLGCLYFSNPSLALIHVCTESSTHQFARQHGVAITICRLSEIR